MAGMSEGTKPRRRWFQFSLAGMFWLVAIAAGISWLAWAIMEARYAAHQSAYGHQRLSRWQAEVIHRGPLANMPDSEFRTTDNPSDGLPQRGQPYP